MAARVDDNDFLQDVLTDALQILAAFFACLVAGLLLGGAAGGGIGLAGGLFVGYAVMRLQDWRDARRRRVQTPAQGQPITHPATDC